MRTAARTIRPYVIAVTVALLVMLASAGLTGITSADAQEGSSTETVVLDGADRYETAAMIALSVYPANQSTETLMIANGETMVDALVLGGNIDASTERRLLLVRRDDIPEATREALQEISHARLVFLGGDDAISPAVRDDVASLTCNYVTGEGPC